MTVLVFLLFSLCNIFLVQSTAATTFCSKGGRLTVNLSVESTTWKTDAFEFNTRTFGGTIPGPTIVISPGDELTIKLTNNLEGPEAEIKINELGKLNTTNLHLHGFHVSSEGNQDNVFLECKPGETLTYTYVIPHDHASGTFWYHPHVHGSGGAQLGGGMAGAIIVLDRNDEKITPPEFRNIEEVLLVFQEAIFTGAWMHNGNLVALLKDGGSKMDLGLNDKLGVGSYVTVNGDYQPSVTLKQNILHRLRLVNAAGHTYVFPNIPESCDPYLIAVDGIYLEKPEKTNRVPLPPGGRADLLLRCSSAGLFDIMNDYANEVKAGIPGAPTVQNIPLLKFNIVETSNQGLKVIQHSDVKLPPRPAFLEDLTQVDSKPSFEVAFAVHPSIGISGIRYNHQKALTDVELGSVYTWYIYIGDKMMPMQHPYHQHVNHFQIVDLPDPSLPFNVSGRKIGMWRDTLPVNVKPTTIRFKPRAFPGKMVLHCHLVAHSDYGMMGFVNVTGTMQEYYPQVVETLEYPHCTPSLPPPQNSENENSNSRKPEVETVQTQSLPQNSKPSVTTVHQFPKKPSSLDEEFRPEPEDLNLSIIWIGAGLLLFILISLVAKRRRLHLLARGSDHLRQI